jgi:hypothetical protein
MSYPSTWQRSLDVFRFYFGIAESRSHIREDAAAVPAVRISTVGDTFSPQDRAQDPRKPKWKSNPYEQAEERHTQKDPTEPP